MTERAALTIVTGNADKAREIAKQLGMEAAHTALDLYEVQSLDIREIVEAKAREAYQKVGSPVLVDDVSLTIDELGGLPGPLVKWFLRAIGNEGICRFADASPNRAAVATVAIGYFDGKDFEAFISDAKGSIAEHPRGDGGYGWDAVFIHEGAEGTRAELGGEERHGASIRTPALLGLKAYLSRRS